MNLTSNRRVLPDTGLAEVATRNRPLGEKERCSTPMSLLLSACACGRLLAPALRVPFLVTPVRWLRALESELCQRSSKAAIPETTCCSVLELDGSLKVCYGGIDN